MTEVDEAIARHRDAIAYWEADLADETDPGERDRIQTRIDKHRERRDELLRWAREAR